MSDVIYSPLSNSAARRLRFDSDLVALAQILAPLSRMLVNVRGTRSRHFYVIIVPRCLAAATFRLPVRRTGSESDASLESELESDSSVAPANAAAASILGDSAMPAGGANYRPAP